MEGSITHTERDRHKKSDRERERGWNEKAESTIKSEIFHEKDILCECICVRCVAWLLGLGIIYQSYLIPNANRRYVNKELNCWKWANKKTFCPSRFFGVNKRVIKSNWITLVKLNVGWSTPIFKYDLHKKNARTISVIKRHQFSV